MKDHRDALPAAQLFHFFVPRHHYTALKDAFRGVQRVLNQRLSLKLCHQLVPAKTFSQPRRHDHTAKLSKRHIQIHQKHILAAAQFCEERQLLSAHGNGQPFPLHQPPDRVTVVRAAGFQVPDLVYGSPFPFLLRQTAQHPHACLLKALRQRPHPVLSSGQQWVKTSHLDGLFGNIFP